MTGLLEADPLMWILWQEKGRALEAIWNVGHGYITLRILYLLCSLHFISSSASCTLQVMKRRAAAFPYWEKQSRGSVGTKVSRLQL